MVVPFNELKGTYLLNLRHIVFRQAVEAGIRMGYIAVSDECTYNNRKEFFSHRRDGRNGLNTGRMAAVMGLRPSVRSKGNS